MDERIEIWNVLHDGSITAIEQNGDTLTMFISIPYVRRRMKPIGDSFVLTHSGLSRMDFYDPWGETHSFRKRARSRGGHGANDYYNPFRFHAD